MVDLGVWRSRQTNLRFHIETRVSRIGANGGAECGHGREEANAPRVFIIDDKSRIRDKVER